MLPVYLKQRDGTVVRPVKYLVYPVPDYPELSNSINWFILRMVGVNKILWNESYLLSHIH